uniref:FERM domain-containing protein 5 n=1 Tax=Schistosoma haematobium TaxID=6185 RepID=A0A094ZPB8_SCHHA
MSLSWKSPQSHESENDKNNVGRKSVILSLLSPSKGRLFGSNTSIADMPCSVHLLDDRCMSVSVSNKAFGRCLLEVVCERLDVLPYISYFGLRYSDNNGMNVSGLDVLTFQWINLNDKISKQLKEVKNSTFGFRFIYYPNNPLACFPNETIRYLLFLQLRRDFYVGRLRAQAMKIYELAAYAIQAEHGLKEIPQGFDVDTIPGGMRVLPQLTKPIVRRIKNQLEQIIGMSKSEAVEKFIDEASKIETYGMEPFQVQILLFIHSNNVSFFLIVECIFNIHFFNSFFKDQRQNGLCIGFNYKGISIFKDGCSINVFEWAFIKNIYPEKKNLVLVVSGKPSEDDRDLVLGFKCKSPSEAKTLCLRALNCKTFKEVQLQEMSLIPRPFRTSNILAYRPSEIINQDSLSDSSDSSQYASLKCKYTPTVNIQTDVTTTAATTTTTMATKKSHKNSTSSEASENTAWPIDFTAFVGKECIANNDVNQDNTNQNNDDQTHRINISYLDPPSKPVNRVSPRTSFGGSMDLPIPSEKKLQVSELSWKSKPVHRLVNSSSINVNNEDDK